MTDESAVESGVPVRVEDVLRVPFVFILDRWETAPPPSHVDPGLLARSSAVLDGVGWLTRHPEVDRVRQALAAADTRAIGALARLDECLGLACDALLQRCRRSSAERQWAALRHGAALAERLTAAAGRDGDRALALFLLASAHRAFEDSRGAVDAYRECIETAARAGDAHRLAVANDNLANVLVEVGQFDEAIRCYQRAMSFESDPQGRRAIMSNWANAISRHAFAMRQRRAVSPSLKQWSPALSPRSLPLEWTSPHRSGS